MALTLLQSNGLCNCQPDEKGEEGEEEERDNPLTACVCRAHRLPDPQQM